MADTFPVFVYPSDATVQALNGNTDQATGLVHLAKFISQASTPSYQVQYDRNNQRLFLTAAPIAQGMVGETGALAVGVRPISYTLAGARKHFAGATAQAVVDNDTNYVYLDSGNLLVINITGFPADITTFVPLAEVVAASGVLTITDKRDETFFHVPQVAGAYALATLGNLGTVAIDKSLLAATDNLIDLGSATKRWRDVYVATALKYIGASGFKLNVTASDIATADRALLLPDPGQADTVAYLLLAQTLTAKTLVGGLIDAAGITFKQTTANALVKALDQAVARIYSIPDAGVDANFVLTAGTQTLAAGTTLTAPTIADLTNANHDHGAANKGGVLTNTSHGTGKYCPVSPATHYESGTLVVATLAAEYVAPFAFTLRTATGRVKTAPTDATLIVDVLINGSSIYANQTEMVSILTATNQDTSATKDHAVAAGDVITYQVEQVGSTVAGADLTMTLNGLAALDTV